ncbi:MAG: hypothetical protein NUV34_02020 [Sulfuricaulis sp.]|nr:hypothetical protein [Sulfuricaulis sp.]
MDFVTVFFGIVISLGLATIVGTIHELNQLMKRLPDKNTMIELMDELREIRSSIEEISQKIRENGRRELIEPDVLALAENRDRANPDLMEVLEEIRDK